MVANISFPQSGFSTCISRLGFLVLIRRSASLSYRYCTGKVPATLRKAVASRAVFLPTPLDTHTHTSKMRFTIVFGGFLDFSYSVINLSICPGHRFLKLTTCLVWSDNCIRDTRFNSIVGSNMMRTRSLAKERLSVHW